MSAVMGHWNKTEELSSYLVEITEACLRVKDPDDSSDLVEKIMDKAGQKGTGLWTVVSALELGASVPTIYASLNGRVMSAMKDQRNYAETILKGNNPTFVDFGNPTDGMPLLMDAVVLATIASYAQGMDILRLASDEYNYELEMPSIAQIWKGCLLYTSPSPRD